MARLALTGGSYSARSIIANCQRCINLFPEVNPKDSPVPLTHYQRPGLRPLAQGPNAPVRGLWRASNGQGYAVIGQNVYYVTSGWQLNLLGQLATPGTVPCSLTDNGIEALLVDSSALGYTINLATNAFAQFADPTGTFVGATRVDTIDTFVLANIPGTNKFNSTLSNELLYDPTYVAAKADYPDPLVSIIVNRHEILLLGQVKSEIWYDAGNPLFPFAELPGAYIEHGVLAPYSVASMDIAVYWLGQDLQGDCVVYRQRGYECKRISTHAIEYALQQIKAKGISCADAIGYTYQQGGHAFYVLALPVGDQTWAYDEASELWSQRAWTDGDAVLHRDRTNCCANLYGQNVVGDWQNGTIYAMDPEVYTDTVAGNAGPISWIRTFPHLMAGLGAGGQLVLADGKRVRHKQFIADLECGNAAIDQAGNPPKVTLRYSDDRGKTYKGSVLQSAGALGEYLTSPSVRGLGIARDRVYELEYSFAGKAALNGAWVEAEVLES